ncbi:dispersed gene family protein 1 (DGF-1), partial [Trypanosoma cruzi]
SGVLIRVSRTVMRSSAVAFIRAFPQHCDIAVTEVDAVQTFEFDLPGTVSKTLSVLLLRNVVLSASTLLVSNVNAHALRCGGFGLYSIGTLLLVGGSSLYTRYCSFDGYTYLLYVYRLSVCNHHPFLRCSTTQCSPGQASCIRAMHSACRITACCAW